VPLEKNPFVGDVLVDDPQSWPFTAMMKLAADLAQRFEISDLIGCGSEAGVADGAGEIAHPIGRFWSGARRTRSRLQRTHPARKRIAARLAAAVRKRRSKPPSEPARCRRLR
jgi:hypothetical protein